MKKLFVLLALAGCNVSYDITPRQIEHATLLCAVNGGIQEVYVSSDSYRTFCKNGARFVHNK